LKITTFVKVLSTKIAQLFSTSATMSKQVIHQNRKELREKVEAIEQQLVQLSKDIRRTKVAYKHNPDEELYKKLLNLYEVEANKLDELSFVIDLLNIRRAE
jgi:superfamily II DNA/RNA helicase